MPALPILLAFILGLGFVGVLLAVGRNNKPFLDQGTTFTLKHSAFLRWFSIVTVFGGTAGFALSTVLFPPTDPLMTWLNTAGVTLLGTCGMALLWESFRWSLTVSPTGLDCQSPWKPRKLAGWSDVTSVTYSKMNSWYIVRFRDGKSFRVPAIVPGVQRFVDVTRKKLTDNSSV
ncbi:hypothetical protein BH11PLA2_BH11PLA2_36180 [soil metagenome]